MTAREIEAELLTRCAAVGRGQDASAQDQREANVFRLAALILRWRFPQEASQWFRISDAYFSQYPEQCLEPGEVVRKGWVFDLPRLRDMLTLELSRNIKK
ncbi:MAG: hypothetical protein RL748_2816 [Pseudomonadota bacterium]|jgi:hypothetical protein